MDCMARIAPHNTEAEQLLIGAMLINNDVVYKVDGICSGEQFYEPLHVKIFNSIIEFQRRSIVATPITLKSLFLQEGEEISEYLVTLTTKASSIIDIQGVARIVKDLYLKRKLVEAGESIVHDAFEAEYDAKTQIESAEKTIYDIATYGDSERRNSITLSESLDQVIKTVAASCKSDKAIPGVSTGFSELDKLLGGLQKSDLIVLAGRPSMGKTALAVNIAINACEYIQSQNAGGGIAFFSLEMSSEQLGLRILSMRTKLNSSKIRLGMITGEQFQCLVSSTKELNNMPMFIDDTPAITIAQIRSRVRKLQRTCDISGVFVDYLQLVRATRGGDNRVQEVSDITQGLKSIAKEMNIPVFALSQLSRSVEQRDNKRPLLSDLRESGSIEQDSDIVMFIYREAYYLIRQQPKEGTEQHREWQNKMELLQSQSEVIVAKQRNGPIGNLKLHFDMNTTKFSNISSIDIGSLCSGG